MDFRPTAGESIEVASRVLNLETAVEGLKS
jgi:hypothetical protein